MSFKASLLILLALGAACTNGGSADEPALDAARGPETPDFDASASGAGRDGRGVPREAAAASTDVAVDASAPVLSMDAQRPAASDADGSAASDASTSVPAHWDLCAQLAFRAQVRLPDGPTVSWARLLCDTVDLARFTRAPSPAYTASMASSYNRASTREGAPGWFANADFGFYLRDQGDEHVMMEARGPGVITRLWSPNPSGTLRIYVDDPDVPAIEVPMIELLSGKFGHRGASRSCPWPPRATALTSRSLTPRTCG